MTIRPGKMAAMLGACLLGSMLSIGSHAQEAYPNRPVTIIVPFGAGGFTDNVGRLIAAGLAEKWKSSVIVENKPGAGGNIGAGHAAKQPADGYTLYLSNTATNVINPNIYTKLSYDPATDFEPVVLVVKTPNVVAVGPNVAANTIDELIALAKAKPGAINFGTPGNGTTGHFVGTLFATTTGIEMAHVPYKSTPQVQADIMGGSIQVAFDNVTSWAPQVTAGRVRALAVTSTKRSPLLPNVPTLQELGMQGFEATTFAGISVPKGTPRAVVDKLNADIRSVIEKPEFQSKMSGGEIGGGTPESYKEYTAAEFAKWGAVARQIGLKVE